MPQKHNYSDAPMSISGNTWALFPLSFTLPYFLKSSTMHTPFSKIKCMKVFFDFFSNDLQVSRSLQYGRQPFDQLFLSLNSSQNTRTSQEEGEDWRPVITGRKRNTLNVLSTSHGPWHHVPQRWSNRYTTVVGGFVLFCLFCTETYSYLWMSGRSLACC